MTNSEIKDYILDVTGELVDDFSNQFANVVIRALSMYNRYNKNIVSTTELVSSSSKTMSGPPYPKQVSVSSVEEPYDRMDYPTNVIAEYDPSTGILEVNPIGAYRISAMYDWTLADLDTTHIDFLDLVLAYFKMGVGSKRKSFQLDDLPFTSDAADRYQEGKDLEEQVIERLQDNVATWEAII